MTVQPAEDSFRMIDETIDNVDDSINCPNWVFCFIVIITLPIWFILWVPLFILSIANHIMEYTCELTQIYNLFILRMVTFHSCMYGQSLCH